jgi:hypothetical protein
MSASRAHMNQSLTRVARLLVVSCHVVSRRARVTSQSTHCSFVVLDRSRLHAARDLRHRSVTHWRSSRLTRSRLSLCRPLLQFAIHSTTMSNKRSRTGAVINATRKKNEEEDDDQMSVDEALLTPEMKEQLEKAARNHALIVQAGKCGDALQEAQTEADDAIDTLNSARTRAVKIILKLVTALGDREEDIEKIIAAAQKKKKEKDGIAAKK